MHINYKSGAMLAVLATIIAGFLMISPALADTTLIASSTSPNANSSFDVPSGAYLTAINAESDMGGCGAGGRFYDASITIYNSSSTIIATSTASYFCSYSNSYVSWTFSSSYPYLAAGSGYSYSITGLYDPPIHYVNFYGELGNPFHSVAFNFPANGSYTNDFSNWKLDYTNNVSENATVVVSYGTSQTNLNLTDNYSFTTQTGATSTITFSKTNTLGFGTYYAQATLTDSSGTLAVTPVISFNVLASVNPYQPDNDSNVAGVGWSTDQSNPNAQGVGTTFYLPISLAASSTISFSFDVGDGNANGCGYPNTNGRLSLYALSSNNPTATTSLVGVLTPPTHTRCSNNPHQIISYTSPNQLNSGWYFLEYDFNYSGGYGGYANSSFNIEGTSVSNIYDGTPYQSSNDINWTSETGSAYITIQPPKIPPAPAISSLNQFKSDGITSIATGTITTDATTTFQAVASSPQNLQVKLAVDVIDSNSGNVVATSSGAFVPSGSTTSVAINLPDGSYRWRAQAIDSNGAVSTSTYFNASDSTDFIVKLVPLYTQVSSDFPDQLLTKTWSQEVYANRAGTISPGNCGLTIGKCGCAITSVVMIGKYYGVNFGIDGADLTPNNINDWLETTTTQGLMVGYDSHGNVIWSQAAIYAQDFSSGIGLHFDGLTNSTDEATLNKYLSLSEPVILYNRSVGHYIVADGQLATTYTVKDPDFYTTKTLNDVANTTTTYDYHNAYTNLRLFSQAFISNSSNIAERGMYLSLGSPAELLITDPNNNKLGIDPSTGATYNQISGGVYSSEGISDGSQLNPSQPIESKFAWIPNPVSGIYNIQVIGTGSGSYTLQSVSYDASSTAHSQIVTGNITPNVSIPYALNFTPQQPQNISLAPQDVTPPTISHTSLASQYFLNSAPISFAFNATDTGSGVYSVTSTLDGAPISSPTTINFNKVGSHTIVISALDFAGNTTSTTLSYNVVYNFVGPLLPFKMNGNFFNVGRMLPVKFKAYDANNNLISGIKASLSYAKVINGQAGQFTAASSSGNANIGNQFRFDPYDKQYIYNWSVENIPPGTYRLRIDLDDGTSHFVDIVLLTRPGPNQFQGGKDGNKNVFIYDFIIKQIINTATTTPDKRFGR